jgi:hypothetical protein
LHRLSKLYNIDYSDTDDKYKIKLKKFVKNYKNINININIKDNDNDNNNVNNSKDNRKLNLKIDNLNFVRKMRNNYSIFPTSAPSFFSSYNINFNNNASNDNNNTNNIHSSSSNISSSSFFPISEFCVPFSQLAQFLLCFRSTLQKKMNFVKYLWNLDVKRFLFVNNNNCFILNKGTN